MADGEPRRCAAARAERATLDPRIVMADGEPRRCAAARAERATLDPRIRHGRR
jgi:hypothetical protein